jgi:hypothetical protein
MKIYVLDLITKQTQQGEKYFGEEFLENQIHYTNLQKAKTYATCWLEKGKGAYNTENIKGLLASISEAEYDDLTEEEIQCIEDNGYCDYVEYNRGQIVWEKEIDLL